MMQPQNGSEKATTSEHAVGSAGREDPAQPAADAAKNPPRRRRRRRTSTNRDATSQAAAEATSQSTDRQEGSTARKTRRRGGRRRRSTSAGAKQSAAEPRKPETSEPAENREEEAAVEKASGAVAQETSPSASRSGQESGASGKKRRRRSRPRRRASHPAEQEPSTAPEASAAKPSAVESSESGRTERAAKPFPEATPIGENDRVMLINVAEDECRIAVVHKNRLEELFIERASGRSNVGNIYKGRVTNIEPSIQAAFVDFGCGKNGFLHISDLQPQYFPDGQRHTENVGRKTPRRDRPPIQKCLRRGQEVIVQVIKEGIGTKGPTLSSYISIPGRYLVMMPGMSRLGVSRKIEDEEARRKMRRILEELDLPKNMGFILRTAGLDRTKTELRRDLKYLERLWKVVAERIRTERAPCELYRESDLVTRTIRDVYSSDFDRVIVDSEETAVKVRGFLSLAMPRSAIKVELYSGHKPLFYEFGIEREIELLHQRHVPLASGGSLVIDTTEAMVTIDVNSGRFREHNDAEQTAYRTNLEAAEEIARQLRLRDLGGLILCDFIDMRQEKHKRAVERTVREALRKHKERAKCLRLSQFCIMEMTRQRMRPPIKGSLYQECPYCRGAGTIKNAESMTLDIIRVLRIAATSEHVKKILMRVPPQVAFDLQNRKRAQIHAMEQDNALSIVIQPDPHVVPDRYELECYDVRGSLIPAPDLVCVPPAEPAARGTRQHAAEAPGTDAEEHPLANMFE